MGMLLSSCPWIHTPRLSLVLKLSIRPAHPLTFSFPKARNKMHSQVGKHSCEDRREPGVGPRALQLQQLMPHPSRERHRGQLLTAGQLLSSLGSEHPTAQAYAEKWQFWKATTHFSHLAAPGNLLALWKQCLHCQHRGSIFRVTAAGKEKSKPNDCSVDTHCKVNWSCNPEKGLCLIRLFSWATLELEDTLLALCLEIFFPRKYLMLPLLFCKKFWNFSRQVLEINQCKKHLIKP